MNDLLFFIVKQQGSQEPTRCEASWKGRVLIDENKRFLASLSAALIFFIILVLMIWIVKGTYFPGGMPATFRIFF